MMTPTSPYWPLRGWTEYNYFLISTDATHPVAGKFNPATQCIEVDGVSTLHDHFRRTYALVAHSPYPAVAILDTRPGVVPLPDWSNVEKVLVQSLYNGADHPQYIGEIGNTKALGWAPEAEITLNPVAGEVLQGTSSCYDWDEVTGAVIPSSISWKYRTIGPGPGPNGVWWWPQYPDQMMTTLWERPDQPEGWVYNYLFARNVGLLNFWWGWKRADNTMDPAQFWQWQITGHGP